MSTQNWNIDDLYLWTVNRAAARFFFVFFELLHALNYFCKYSEEGPHPHVPVKATYCVANSDVSEYTK